MNEIITIGNITLLPWKQHNPFYYYRHSIEEIEENEKSRVVIVYANYTKSEYDPNDKIWKQPSYLFEGQLYILNDLLDRQQEPNKKYYPEDVENLKAEIDQFLIKISKLTSFI